MQLKFIVPLALALASSVSAGTIGSSGLANAKEACANGEVLHTETIILDGKEVKMTTTSCPGIAAREPNRLTKRDILLCNLRCTIECYELGPAPVGWGDCQSLYQSLVSQGDRTFSAQRHSWTTFNDGTCNFSFYNDDDFDYQVCYNSFGSLGSEIANTCVANGRGAGDCSSSGGSGNNWAVEIFNPYGPRK